MKRRLLVPLLAVSLTLPGCSAWDVAGPAVSIGAALLGQRGSPASAGIDASKLTAAEHLAQSVYDSASLAQIAGRMSAATEPDADRDNFCEMVIAELAIVTSRGGLVMKLNCLIDHHLDRAKAARDARDAVSFAEHLAKATNFTNQLRAMVSASVEGATP